MIRQCGYATSPVYTKSLRILIEKYKLYDLDKQGEAMNKNERITNIFSL